MGGSCCFCLADCSSVIAGWVGSHAARKLSLSFFGWCEDNKFGLSWSAIKRYTSPIHEIFSLSMYRNMVYTYLQGLCTPPAWSTLPFSPFLCKYCSSVGSIWRKKDLASSHRKSNVRSLFFGGRVGNVGCESFCRKF